MLSKLLRTDKDVAGLVLRVLLGVVMFPHGAQKLFGWFHGNGFVGTMNWFHQVRGIPFTFAFLAIVAESFGSLGLIAGLLTRVAAFGVACVMVVAALTLHLQNGFFMNWAQRQAGEGFEYHILVLAITIALMIKGGGLWSADGVIAEKLEAGKQPS